MNTNDKQFADPVLILLEPGGEAFAVGSAQEAYQCLTTRWPQGARGEAHQDATDACLKVIDGHRSVVDARDALIRAALQAGLLADADQVPRRQP